MGRPGARARTGYRPLAQILQPGALPPYPLSGRPRPGHCRIYADTAYISHEEDDAGVRIQTEGGPVITAKSAVFATNSPVNDKVAIHTKQIPNRTYVIAGVVPKGSVPDMLLWDTYEAYHYVRIQELGETQDLLIVGGEDHRSGRATDQDVRIGKLADWPRRRFPSFDRVEYSWSGQLLEPIDFMPFSGRNPGNKNIYIHTGDSGQGGTAPAMAPNSRRMARS
jgi:glycine/D-amino acid oxidase-like deaminating enzyme